MASFSQIIQVLLVGLALGSEPPHPGGLGLVKRCGDHDCSLYQYCSDGRCLPCDRRCTPGDNNFDHETCELYCQEYIHDKVRHYLTAADSQKATRELQETLEWLRGLVAVSITLSCLVGLAVLAMVGLYFLKQRRKAMIKQRKDLTAISVIGNNNVGGSETKEKSGELGERSVASMTTGLSTTRHPSEDATLEGFAAYDNPALAPSPQSLGRHETTF